MPGNLYGRLLSWCKDDKDRSIRAAVAAAFLVLGILLLIADYLNSVRKTDGIIQRNEHGEGSRTEELEVEIEGEKERIPVEIEVAEQRYTSEEVREMFDRVICQLEQKILGKNESLDRIEYDMNLMTGIPDEPIEISWELDRYDVMNIRGELQEEYLTEDGTLVGLSAVLTYSENREERAQYQCTACVYPEALSEKERNSSQIRKEISRQEEESRTQKELKLPDKILDQEIYYYQKMDRRGIVLIIMGALAGILLYALELQNHGKEQEKKRQQMLLDYPEIVNKMALFLGAGMTVKRAWRKIVEDYDSQKELWGERYVYEEMRRTCHEMESGVTEARCYENFGRRCDIQVFVRFGALLSQNLRKGTRGLTQLLKLESVQAFEERKTRARRLGEEAGTKMLLPMFLMLAVVLVIVIVPAFLSVQI